METDSLSSLSVCQLVIVSVQSICAILREASFPMEAVACGCDAVSSVQTLSVHGLSEHCRLASRTSRPACATIAAGFRNNLSQGTYEAATTFSALETS